MPADRRSFRSQLQRTRTLNQSALDEAEDADGAAAVDKQASSDADAKAAAAAPSGPPKPHPRRRAAAVTVEVEGRKVVQQDVLSEVGPTKDYRGSDERTGEALLVRRVTLKDRATRKEAEAEIELLRHLFTHPHIVQFHAAKVSKKKTDEDGREIKPAQAMYLFELCQGSLRASLSEGLPQEKVLDVFAGGAAALAYLSRLEIVHYNVSVDTFHCGPRGLWKLGDFGCASQTTYELEGAKKKQLAEVAAFLAERCVAHRPPEVQDLTLGWPVGAKVDVLALGCVLFAVMTGEAPAAADSWCLEPSGSVVNGLDPAVIKWFRRCVAKNPKLRASATDLDREVGAFRAVAEEPPDVGAEVLCGATEELAALVSARKYRSAAALTAHVTALVTHFRAGSSSDASGVSEAIAAAEQELSTLRQQLLDDYATVPKPNYDRQKGVEDAAPCVEALDSNLRREIMGGFCDEILEPYREIFTEDGLERWTRRYPWMKRTFREVDEKYGKYFPEAWKVNKELAVLFCHTTRKDVMELFSSASSVADSKELVVIMKETIEFERYLDNKFPSSRKNRRKKTVKFGARRSEKLGTVNLGMGPDTTSFVGMISGCFESHLIHWVRDQETELAKALDKWMQGKADSIAAVGVAAADGEHRDRDGGDLEPRLLFASAQKLLTSMQDCFVNCDFSRRQPLLDLFEATARVLAGYVEKLDAKLPKKARMPLDRNNTQIACCVIGSAEYCDEQAPNLATMVADAIIPELSNDVTYSPQLRQMRDLIKSAHQLLVQSVGSSLDDAFTKMKRISWASFAEGVSKASPYVDIISDKLCAQYKPIAENLSRAHFSYFCDRFARYFIHRFMEEVFQCHKISEQGAAQILLDASFLKTSLLEAPVMCTGSQLKTIYSNFVLREMGKVETMLGFIATEVEDPDAKLTEIFGEHPDEEAEALIDKLLAMRASPSDALVASSAGPGADWKSKLAALGNQLKESREKTTVGLGVLHGNVQNVLQNLNIPGRLNAFKIPALQAICPANCPADDVTVTKTGTLASNGSQG